MLRPYTEIGRAIAADILFLEAGAGPVSAGGGGFEGAAGGVGDGGGVGVDGEDAESRSTLEGEASFCQVAPPLMVRRMVPLRPTSQQT